MDGFNFIEQLLKVNNNLNIKFINWSFIIQVSSLINDPKWSKIISFCIWLAQKALLLINLFVGLGEKTFFRIKSLFFNNILAFMELFRFTMNMSMMMTFSEGEA